MWNDGVLFESSRLALDGAGAGFAWLAKSAGIWNGTLRTESGAIGAMGVGRDSPSLGLHSILAALIQSRVALMTGTAAQTPAAEINNARRRDTRRPRGR